jgi:hypothetical protein
MAAAVIQPALLYQSVATVMATLQHLSFHLQANDWRYFVPADSGHSQQGIVGSNFQQFFCSASRKRKPRYVLEHCNQHI